jgi:hypothetical protein
LNKRLISPIIIALITLLSILPAAPIRVHAASTAAINVNLSPETGPQVVVGNPGDVFTATVTVDAVSQLLGYSVTLLYNGITIHVTSVDFTGPFAGFPTLTLNQGCSDATGVCASSETLLGASPVDITSPTPVMTITYTVVARTVSDLHVVTDTECACASLAGFSNGHVIAVPHTTLDGKFFAEPNILFQKSFNVTADPKITKLSSGATTVTLSSGLILHHNESVAGFAQVIFDIVAISGPNAGTTYTVSSNVAFFLVGSTITVTGTFHLPKVSATYALFGTLLRGPDVAILAPFDFRSGQTFKVA